MQDLSNYDILIADKIFDMNQQKALQLLNSIMPDISTSGDPGTEMLKCARANNLAPAQLEKLAQVFNTMKTNYFMDHQSNRGDSFPLINVPELMTKYATYTPETKVEDSPVNTAAFDVTFKYAAAEGSELPSLAALWEASGGTVQEDDDCWRVLAVDEPEYDIAHEKLAAAAPVTMPRNEEILRARDKANQVYFETGMDLGEKCASLMAKFTPDEGRWAEAVEDTIFGLGKEAAVAIELVEDYFEEHAHKYKGADLSKRAGANVLVQDRHGVWKDMRDICQLVEMQKEAHDLMEKLAFPTPPPGNKPKDPNLPKTKRPVTDALASAAKVTTAPGRSIGHVVGVTKDLTSNDTVHELMNAMLAPKALTTDDKKYLAGMKVDAKRNAALQQLVLSDSVLREADPYKVQDLFNTIASISPTLADNHLLMGPVLKEALQYDSIPTQMLKDLVSIEKDQASRQKDQFTIDKLTYGA